MRIVKKIVKGAGWTVVVGVAAAALLGAHTWYARPLSIDWFYARTFAQFALERPEMLSSMRILPGWLDFYGDRLDDASPEAEDRAFALVRDAHATLQRYDRSALAGEARLSYDTMAYFLRIQVEGEPWRRHNFPVNQLNGEQSSLPNFMAQVHQVTNRAEAEAYVARLEQFPRKFAQLVQALRVREQQGIVPPQFTVDKVLQQMQAFIAPAPTAHMLYAGFAAKLAQLEPGALAPGERERLLARAALAVEQRVRPAYRTLIGHFEALRAQARGNFGAWHLPDGERYYAWCIRQHTTTEMTPAQLHALGLAEVARIGGELDALLRAQGLVDGSVGQRLQRLAQRADQLYPNTAEGRSAVLARYTAILDDAARGLDRAFDLRPRQTLEVKAVPEFAQATAPSAYYEAGAFDGCRAGVFRVNLRDTAETPKFAMRTLAHHEGVPGHHFQSAIAQELQELPFFRRVLPFTAYDEGWALYAERLAGELGLLPDALDQLGRLRDEMLRATRLVVDTGIHAQRWTREQAIDYMRTHTGMAESDVVAEVERYFVDPGQALAYQTGMLKIVALREKARSALGERFDLKQFHREVLAHGALPLVVLEGVVDDWIARRRADAAAAAQ